MLGILLFYTIKIALMGCNMFLDEHRYRVRLCIFIKEQYCGFHFIIMIAQQLTATA